MKLFDPRSLEHRMRANSEFKTHVDARARHYAFRIKDQIDKQLYYSKRLHAFGRRMSKEVDCRPSEAVGVIVDRFRRELNTDPYGYFHEKSQDLDKINEIKRTIRLQTSVYKRGWNDQLG